MIHEIEYNFDAPRTFVEVLVVDALTATVRLSASGLQWALSDEVDDLEGDQILLVQVPVPRLPNNAALFDRAVGLISKVANGFTSAVPVPQFLGQLTPVPSRGEFPDALTMPNTDARRAEEALMRRPLGQRGRELRGLVREYLGAISEPQADHEITGNGQKSLRFISHFWDLGDRGVADKFWEVADKMSAKTKPSGKSSNGRNPKVSQSLFAGLRSAVARELR